MPKVSKKNIEIKFLATAVLENEDGQILLLRRSENSSSFKNYWQFPEGKLERGEDFKEALVREVKEELNLDVRKAVPLTAVKSEITIRNSPYILVRVAFLVGCEGKISLSDEHSELKWFGTGEISRIKKVKGVKEIVDTWQKEKKNVCSFVHRTERDGEVYYRQRIPKKQARFISYRRARTFA